MREREGGEEIGEMREGEGERGQHRARGTGSERRFEERRGRGGEENADREQNRRTVPNVQKLLIDVHDIELAFIVVFDLFQVRNIEELREDTR